jgi:hypothetical protein
VTHPHRRFWIPCLGDSLSSAARAVPGTTTAKSATAPAQHARVRIAAPRRGDGPGRPAQWGPSLPPEYGPNASFIHRRAQSHGEWSLQRPGPGHRAPGASVPSPSTTTGRSGQSSCGIRNSPCFFSPLPAPAIKVMVEKKVSGPFEDFQRVLTPFPPASGTRTRPFPLDLRHREGWRQRGGEGRSSRFRAWATPAGKGKRIRIPNCPGRRPPVVARRHHWPVAAAGQARSLLYPPPSRRANNVGAPPLPASFFNLFLDTSECIP